jgi:hypothetical protein
MASEEEKRKKLSELEEFVERAAEKAALEGARARRQREESRVRTGPGITREDVEAVKAELARREQAEQRRLAAEKRLEEVRERRHETREDWMAQIKKGERRRKP